MENYKLVRYPASAKLQDEHRLNCYPIDPPWMGIGPEAYFVPDDVFNEVYGNNYRVYFISSATADKLPLVKEVKNITGLGLKESKDVVEEGSVMLPGKYDEITADSVVASLRILGASAEVVFKID